MKVQGYRTNSVANKKSAERAAEADRTSSSGAKARRVTDQVQLSPVAQEVSQAMSAESGDVAPTDPARIEALRDAIREGRYPLDAEALAEAIVDEDLPMFGSDANTREH